MSIKTKMYPLNRVIPLTKIRQGTYPSRFVIATKLEYRIIEVTNILYLKSDSNYTEIYLRDGSKIVTSVTLKRYEVKLDPFDFIRVHNSHIIQQSQIEYFFHQDNKIILHNAQEIPVSRSRKEGLVNHLRTLMV